MTVRIHDEKRRTFFVKCPLCSTATYIARDGAAWIEHMERVHSAVTGTWSDTGIRGAQEGPADGHPRTIRYGHNCYGCRATFSTEAALKAHLLSVHNAS